jgi:hypothetical protein
MGQKANLLTLRFSKNFFNLTLYNSKNFVVLYNFLKLYKFLFLTKNVLITNINLNIVNNQIFLNLQLFYKNKKIENYEKYIKKISDKKLYVFNNLKKKHNLSFKSNLISVFFLLYKKLRCNLIIFSILNLNRKINFKTFQKIFFRLKKFKYSLFSRRYNLFIDFIKITSLLIKNQISAEQYLKFLSIIFKVLRKRSHNIFFSFLKQIFTDLIETIPSYNKISNKKVSKIIGIKILINGRIKGKPRANSFFLQQGSIKTQNINENIEFAQVNTYTLLGAFGFQFWLSRKYYNI